MQQTNMTYDIMSNPQRLRMSFRGEIVAKPRMTRRDRWKQRTVVTRYFDFRDAFHNRLLEAGFEPDRMTPVAVTVMAFLPIPASYSKAKVVELASKPHQIKPDADNILKAVCDALRVDDKTIYKKHIEKYWDDGLGERLEIELAWVWSLKNSC